MIKRILSRAKAKYVCFDIENFYLSTPLGRPEYVKIQVSKIPQEFINEHNLNISADKGWVYFEIRRGCYGLPKSGIIENMRQHVANSVLYHETGKQLYYGQLRMHPKFQETRNKYFPNEMGKLCQGA